MKKKNKYYVTTPIYYVTAAPHLGSLYSTVLADTVSRWNKVLGKKTFLLTGTDEHGQKIALAAEKVGKKPKEFVDGFIDAYKNVWKLYDINYNHFIRTTDKKHVAVVQNWIKMLQEKGDIYKSSYEGWYCTPDEAFIMDPEIKKEKSNPLCPDCGREATWVSEECYFFKLSKYQDKLLQFYKDNPDFITPKERMREVVSFVKSGLKDLSISRTTVSWGIPFPGDEKHVAYVWADALNNYITAIGYGQSDKIEDFNYWWPADLHILGKDIVRFHAVYWPAFLMASGLEMPKKLLVHGWLTVDKKKMSKSLGNVIDPVVLFKKYGSDQIRYYLLRQLAVNQDGDFSIKDLHQRIDSELANDLGNLLNRMVTLVEKNKIEIVRAPKIWDESIFQLRSDCKKMIEQFSVHMNECKFHIALSVLWKFINKINSFFHSQEPWKLAKQEKGDLFMQVMSATAHSLRAVATVLWPVMPNKMMQLFESLGITFEPGKVSLNDLNNWDQNFMLIKLKETLFPSILLSTDSSAPVVAKDITGRQDDRENEYIKIQDLAKIALAVGTIENVEELEGSEKLLKMKVNCGQFGIRQILAGVKKFYKPEELIGKQGIFVLNLKPRKMMGIESQGMMLMAQDEDGKPQMTTVFSSVPNGTKLK